MLCRSLEIQRQFVWHCFLTLPNHCNTIVIAIFTFWIFEIFKICLKFEFLYFAYLYRFVWIWPSQNIFPLPWTVVIQRIFQKDGIKMIIKHKIFLKILFSNITFSKAFSNITFCLARYWCIQIRFKGLKFPIY